MAKKPLWRRGKKEGKDIRAGLQIFEKEKEMKEKVGEKGVKISKNHLGLCYNDA